MLQDWTVTRILALILGIAGLMGFTGVTLAAEGLDALARPAAPPAQPNSINRVLCLQDDNFNHGNSNTGLWNLDVGGGVVSGIVTYSSFDPICTYSVSGTNSGPNFTLGLVQTSASCCDGAQVTGIASKVNRRADGTITWICNGVPTPGATTWLLCQ